MTIARVKELMKGRPRTPGEIAAYELGQRVGFNLVDINEQETKKLIDDLDENIREAFIDGYEYGYDKADKTEQGEQNGKI